MIASTVNPHRVRQHKQIAVCGFFAVGVLLLVFVTVSNLNGG